MDTFISAAKPKVTIAIIVIYLIKLLIISPPQL